VSAAPAPSGASADAPADAALRAVSDVVLAISAELAVEPILQRLVESARELVGADYGALGVPDGRGGFARFITSGMSDALIARLGPLPRVHGLLAAMLESPEPYRTPDIKADPRYRWWPKAHPDMRSFLGVPIAGPERVLGAIYLTNKRGAEVFSDADQELIQLLAAHAAVALQNAELHERTRELSVVEERTRLARELHDAVSQTLFSLVMTVEAASTLLDRDTGQARARLDDARRLAQDASRELRSLIFELRPADLAHDGLAGTLRKHVEVLARVQPVEIALELDCEPSLPPEAQVEVFRIAQEAIGNALRHADAGRIAVELRSVDGGVRLTVADDGRGFDPSAPELRSRRLGLTSLRERAKALGGRLGVESAPGAGTTVRLDLPAAP
jgi:signal transduction histidine kinase